MTSIAGYAKAVVAFLLAGLTALGTALADERVTQAEWVAVVIAALATTSGVWAMPNRTADPVQALDESMALDDGHGALSTIVWVLLAIVLVVVLLRLVGVA